MLQSETGSVRVLLYANLLSLEVNKDPLNQSEPASDFDARPSTEPVPKIPSFSYVEGII